MQFTPGSSLTPPNTSELLGIEDYYLGGRALPDSFRRFLANFNGAVPRSEDAAFHSGAIDNDVVIERFLPSIENVQEHPDGWADIEVVITQIFDRLKYDPEADRYQLIPFAALVAGDFLVLDYRFDPPAVSFWDHERSEENAPNATVIADTFDEFLTLIDVELPE